MEKKRDTEELLCFQVSQGKVLPGEALGLNGIKAVYGAFATSMDEEVLKKKMEVHIDKYVSIKIYADGGDLLMMWDNEYISEPESAILLYVLSEKFEWLIYKSPIRGKGFALSSVPKKNPSTGEVLTKLESLQHFKAYIEIWNLLREKAFGNWQCVYGFCFEGAKTNKFWT